MSRIVHVLLGATLFTLGATVQAVGPHPLIVIASMLAFACLLYPDKAWDPGYRRADR